MLQLYRAGMSPGGDSEGGGQAAWIPVELEMVTKLWLPDTEILRLKGFHRLSVLDRLQVSGMLRCFALPLSSLLSFPANPLAQQLLRRSANPGRQ